MASATRSEATPLGRETAAALGEVASHLRGQIRLPSKCVTLPDRVDAAAIRRELKLSQTAFADRYGLSVGALRAWEQGRRRPDPVARALLLLVQHRPDLVTETLGQSVEETEIQEASTDTAK